MLVIEVTRANRTSDEYELLKYVVHTIHSKYRSYAHTRNGVSQFFFFRQS